MKNQIIPESRQENAQLSCIAYMFAMKTTQNLPEFRFHCKHETQLKGKFANVCITIQSTGAQPQAKLYDLKNYKKCTVSHQNQVKWGKNLTVSF